MQGIGIKNIYVVYVTIVTLAVLSVAVILAPSASALAANEIPACVLPTNPDYLDQIYYANSNLQAAATASSNATILVYGFNNSSTGTGSSNTATADTWDNSDVNQYIVASESWADGNFSVAYQTATLSWNLYLAPHQTANGYPTGYAYAFRYTSNTNSALPSTPTYQTLMGAYNGSTSLPTPLQVTQKIKCLSVLKGTVNTTAAYGEISNTSGFTSAIASHTVPYTTNYPSAFVGLNLAAAPPVVSTGDVTNVYAGDLTKAYIHDLALKGAAFVIALVAAFFAINIFRWRPQ